AERARAQRPRSGETVTLGERAANTRGDIVVEDRGVARDFLHRRIGCGRDGGPAGQRLQERQAEAFVPRWKDEARRLLVQADELLLGDVTTNLGAAARELGRETLVLGRPRDDEPATERVRRVRRYERLLVRLDGADKQKERT